MTKIRENAVDESWLAQRVEPILEPEIPVIDPHHHLFVGGPLDYPVATLLKDAQSGHNVVATVYSDGGNSNYRKDGPVHLRPVGETEFVARVTAFYQDGKSGPRLCAGIGGVADFMRGAAAEEVFQAHVAAGQGRFRVIRGHTHSDTDPAAVVAGVNWPPGLLGDKTFRAAFAKLAPLNLAYDSWAYHHQLDELADLARAFPETTIVMNHVGGPLGVGSYAAKRDEVRALWRKGIEAAARCPNIHVKIGGLATTVMGVDLWNRATPVSSEEIVKVWAPWLEPCIQLFGPSRCMFESNFPVDKRSHSFAVLFNAFKRIAKGYTAEEKRMLFAGTAATVYRIAL